MNCIFSVTSCSEASRIESQGMEIRPREQRSNTLVTIH